MIKKKKYTLEEVENLTIEEVQKLYTSFINPNQTKIFSSLPFGKELFDKAEGVFMYTKEGKKILLTT
mgnify:FL=1